MEVVSEGAKSWPQDGWSVFHGTTMDNALKIQRKEPLIPLLSQAEDFLCSFGLSLDGMLSDKEFAHMRHFIFERQRESIMSLSDTFLLARNYSLRIPEWQWHLFQHIFAQLEVETEERNWVSLAREYAARQPNPAVMVFKSPTPIPLPDPEFGSLITGGEIRPPVPNPLPEGYELVTIVEIARDTFAR